MFNENTKQQKTYIKMIKYKTKEEVLKDIEEHLTPWEQKELADEVVSKYVDLNEYIDNNRDNIDIEAILDDYIKYHTTDEVLDRIDDAYGIAEYVSNDRYMAEYMLDEFKTRPSDFVDALNRSILTLTDILEEVKENKDLYEELKKFVIEKCIDENAIGENATAHDLIKEKDSI